MAQDVHEFTKTTVLGGMASLSTVTGHLWRARPRSTGDVAGTQKLASSEELHADLRRLLTACFQISLPSGSRALALTGFKFRSLGVFIGRSAGRADVDKAIEHVEPERGSHRSGQPGKKPPEDSTPPMLSEVAAFGICPAQWHFQE